MDYKKKPTSYCGMTIRDNPFYDVWGEFVWGVWG
jgi:hypothetical protein